MLQILLIIILLMFALYQIYQNLDTNAKQNFYLHKTNPQEKEDIVNKLNIASANGVDNFSDQSTGIFPNSFKINKQT